MPLRLNSDEVETYRRDGCVFPVRVMTGDEAAGYRARLEAVEAREGGKLSRRTNAKPHLLLPWLNELMRRPAILDAVEDVIGPDILAWASGFFIKSPGDGGYVTWHQDSTYWGLSESDVVTAWIALSPSNVRNGCMRVMPGTHTEDQLPHKDSFAPGNLLSRGQEIAVQVDEAKALDVELQPGEMSLHHVRLVHGSAPNQGGDRRIGFTVRYIPTRIRQISPVRDSATLVRGTDRFGHFDPEPTPATEFDPQVVAFHDRMLERQTAILYAGAAQRPSLGEARAAM